MNQRERVFGKAGFTVVDMEWTASNIFAGAAGHSATAWARPRQLLRTLDLLAVLAAFVVAALLFTGRFAEQSFSLAADLVFQGMICAVVLFLLYRDGQYSADRRMSNVADLVSVVKNAALAFFFVCGLWLATDGFFTGYRDQSRMLVFTAMLIFAGVLALNRLALTWYQRRLFAQGEGTRKVLLVGQGVTAEEFVDFLEKRPRLGLRCTATMPARGDAFSVERIRTMLGSGEVSDVILALDPAEREDFDRISRDLSYAGLGFRVVPSLFEESLRATRASGFRGVSVFNVDVDPLDHVQRTLKRALDVTVSLAALVVLAPALACIAVAVKLDSRGPVIFRQVRLGIGGRPFEILKFRTMVVDAEARLVELAAHDEGDGPHFKMRHDPRITRVGAFLRRWSMDELLQFVNVLRGDMSLVGPRPPLPREVDKYDTPALIRLRGKPGITGLWQVSGRKDLEFDDMVRLDRQYLENWSLSLDLNVLLRTVSVVLARRGAY
ncbi:MAG: sugar transferase [Armatimonadetes bacterium]|nr:sugar transferase [Armatimonadota bacterium]